MSKPAVSVSFHSQCGGQGFDPPLLHQLFSMVYSHRQLWLFWPSGQYVTNFSKSKLHCSRRRLAYCLQPSSRNAWSPEHQRSEKLCDREGITTRFSQPSSESCPQILPDQTFNSS